MYKEITFCSMSDDRGVLMPIELSSDFENADIPFNVKRCFFIFPKSKITRGHHAHRKFEQVIICLNGSFDLRLKDGNTEKVITLNNRNKGILVESLVWNELENFSNDCQIVVLASGHYDPDEYVNDFDELKELSKQKVKNT